MSIERVRAYFGAQGIDSRIRELGESSATVALAAKALGCEPCRIAKTLALIVGETPILVVTAGDAKIDNAKYRALFPACGSGNSAIGLTIPELEKYSGYPEWVDVCKLSEQQ